MIAALFCAVAIGFALAFCVVFLGFAHAALRLFRRIERQVEEQEKEARRSIDEARASIAAGARGIRKRKTGGSQ